MKVVKSMLSDITSGPTLNAAHEIVIYDSPIAPIVLTRTFHESRVMLSTARLITRRVVPLASV